MRLLASDLVLLILSLSQAEAFRSDGDLNPSDEAIHPTYRNAFHIFNAIHSSMRQWGSSLNHNGMSFFPATVPAGTELYHGTGSSTPVKGMEWLAFEPEHAQQFARRMRGPPNGPSPPTVPGREHPPPPSHERPANVPLPGNGQKPMGISKGNGKSPEWSQPDDDSSGFLHTYLTRRKLNLLYIDGMSAGKTNNGTLDTQDYVLLDDPPPHQGMWDYQRANRMCNVSRDDWGGRVDGFLRMEAGFEIILCHFERDLEVKTIARAYGECRNCEERNVGMGGNLKYLRAVADRYHGIGGDRVHLNYDRMVTAFALGEDLFEPGSKGPRLTKLSRESNDLLRKQTSDMILARPSPFERDGHDWQAVADMIVTRYAARLKYLAMPEVLENEQRLNTELDAMLSSFIDYDSRSLIHEVSRCATRYMPMRGPSSSLAADTVSFVSHYICNKLLSTQHGATASNFKAKQEIIRSLIKTLNWTTWKDCGTCAYDEICSIPIWPFGSEEDWFTPTCRNATTIGEQHGYWGIGGPGGGGHRGPPPQELDQAGNLS